MATDARAPQRVLLPITSLRSNIKSNQYRCRQGVKNRRPTTISAAPPYPNRMYPTSRPYTQYRSSIKTGLPYGDLQEYWL
ncbi:hypothetical protein SORBI_3007G109700 [Sorghum bicolor]|uniref:Uncharacterized protein n=1 Tax=Sorghum bicolor TaxID=4558 RepID=A0A1B6PH44_SORBI|nr:hypothetical protein SORBI_3007G109700 [Sorghum bicolor]